MSRYVALAAALLLAPIAPANAKDGRLTAAISGGTLGIGPELAYRLKDRFAIRGNASLLGFGFEIDTTERTVNPATGLVDVDGAIYDIDVKLRSAGLMFDVFPTGSGFRVSAGVRYNGTKGDADGVPQDRVRFNRFLVFTPEEIGHVVGDFTTRDFAPAVTIGYGGKLRKGMYFGIEAGALFQGAVKVSPLSFEGGIASDEILALPIVQERLEEERQALQDELNNYQVYPILQFSFGWRF